MKILLMAFYWSEGFILAMAAACALGLVLCALLALIRIPRRKKNIGLFAVYLIGATLCALFVQGGLYLAAWIGDQTEYSSQTSLIVGAVFPGIFFLSVIPQFIKVAQKQTLGIEVD